MGSTVAQNRETTQKRGDTHDRETGSGANTAPLQHGNNPHDLPNPDASRADFFDRQALLARIVPTPEKSLQIKDLGAARKNPYKSST